MPFIPLRILPPLPSNNQGPFVLFISACLFEIEPTPAEGKGVPGALSSSPWCLRTNVLSGNK